MAWLLDIPIAVRLAVLFLLAAGVASLLNAAIYGWAWDRRLISPWQPAPEGVGPRSWLDRVPIFGWLRLRRDQATLGRGFWIRPLLIELGFATCIAALYWWEVEQLGLIRPQLAAQLFGSSPTVDTAAIAGPLHWQFLAHALLAALMTIATFIDFDERIIPDEVTFPGTLLGLTLVAIAPMALLPNVQERLQPPAVGVPLATTAGDAIIGPAGGQLYLEPVHLAAPNAWPTQLAGQPGRTSLLIGLGCFWLWAFALTDRRWPRGKRFGQKLCMVLARVRRDFRSLPLRPTLIAGTLLIAMVWYAGGSHWAGLLSSLVGLAVSGSLIWAVRIIGTAVLKREAMGFGDVTLMMMIGTIVGWQASPLIFFLAPGAGLLLAVFNLLLRGDKAIPYGPFLCLATAVVIVCWGPIWVWGSILFGAGWLVPAVLIICFAMLGLLLGLLQGLKALLGITGED